MAKTGTTRYDSADYLKTEKQIAAYLDEALDDGDPSLVRHALGVVARARKNMTELARAANMTRPGLYKALAPEGNPSFDTVMKIAGALGIKLRAEPVSAKHKAA